MKKIIRGIFAISCAALSAAGLAACNKDGEINATVLGMPVQATQLDYQERNENRFSSIKESAENFAADFASLAYKNFGKQENFAVSPLSVYMAMSLAAQCSAGETQLQILSALGITYDGLSAQFSDYYRSVIAEYTDRSEIDKIVQTGMISLSNSIWLDDELSVKQECINTLADNFFCHSYQVDFNRDNKNANEAIRQFVKENTKGLIDKNFELSEETVFTLINTLYLKDVWNTFGRDLSFTDSAYNFAQSDGSVKNTKLLNGYYNCGQVAVGENFKTFFTETENGNRIDFILPKDGYTVGDVFSAENIIKVKGITSYNGVDHDKKQRFYTRCLFPEYTASYDESIKPMLMQMGITSLFELECCDFSAVIEGDAYCSDVKHVTKLKVDSKGIEGAAVTVMGVCGSAGPDEYEDVYEDFIVDKAFGFIISDRYGNTLFSGVVEKI